MSHKLAPPIAISVGDFNGIGAEVILKTLHETDLSQSTPVVISPVEVIQYYISSLSLELDVTVLSNNDFKTGKINILPIDAPTLEINPGKLSKESGQVAMSAIQKGIDLVMQNKCKALVTAPISKEAVNLAGYQIPGHTEYLAAKTGDSPVLMMLVNANLRVALVTAHVPVNQVSGNITKEIIAEKLRILQKSLLNNFGISNPKIAVFGLNPHAGDGGIIGDEELVIISPALDEIRQTGINADGPFPADGFFGQKLHEKYDAILAMYHDQGLAPFKLLSFGKGVNFTAGLPIIRTSPDHGTAFNIAGKGMADPSSFKQAYDIALQLSKKKN